MPQTKIVSNSNGFKVTVEHDPGTDAGGRVGKLTPDQWSQIIQMILALVASLLPVLFPPAPPAAA